ncbi:MAG TPA: sulfotransferase [Fontimonas sp.]
MNSPVATAQPFEIPAWTDRLAGWVAAAPGFWHALGRLETRMLEDRISAIRVAAPIYVCGLARSGSTILLEMLATHPETVTQAYRDFPLVHTPFFWNRFLDRAQRKTAAVERAHGDGILVTPESPEAVEEVLWMSFFPRLHQPGATDVLDSDTVAPAFERYYDEHLRKLLWLRRGQRYLAKGNYNSTRMRYLARLYPDARFVVPLREPLAHVASLQRQHRRFSAHHALDPRAQRYMSRLGHFEFGLDRRAVHTGDAARYEAIRSAWARGDDVEGYALAWDDLYRHIADQLDASPSLRAATVVVRHEALCDHPEAQLQRLFDHCALALAPAARTRLAARLRDESAAPELTPAQRQRITALTAGTLQRYQRY